MLKRLVNAFRRQDVPSARASCKHSYSQCAEDLLVEYVFNLRGNSCPTYLDVGAHDPFYLSNTARLYEKGCRGVNVEANPQLAQRIRDHRPKDTTLNVGVGESDDTLEFFVMEDSSLSTFSKLEMENLQSHGHRLARVERVTLVTMNSIIDKYCNGIFPDFLSIDIEGYDLKVLQSIDFSRTAPKVICVEAAEYSPIGAGARRSDLLSFLAEKQYLEYANTNLNAIMVQRKFWLPSST